MPIVRADLPQGLSDATKAALRQALKAAVVRALAPKETRYIYMALREVFAPLGDGAPTVTVDLRPGRESARKAALASAIAEAMLSAAGIAAEDVYLLFRETPAENHTCGGTPLPNWVPADGGR